MHAVLITFQSTTSLDDLEGPFADYATALGGVDGLLSKVWLQDGSTLGGFHLFETAEKAQAYLDSDLAAGLMATEGFDDFEVRAFSVLGDLSVRTGYEQMLGATATAR